MSTYEELDRNNLILLAEIRGIIGAGKLDRPELIDKLKLDDKQSKRSVVLALLLAINVFGWILVEILTIADLVNQLWILGGLLVVGNFALVLYELSVADDIKIIRARYKTHRAN